MNYINTPFNYTGSKFKLLDQLLPEFDYTKKNFIDLFCGGGSVFTNVVDKYDIIIINDIIKELVDIHRKLLFDTDNFVDEVKRIIPSKTDQDGYIELRKSFNEGKTAEKLFALILSCNNNMMRFNNNFLFNQTFGKRSWNDNTDKKVFEYVQQLEKYKNKIKFYSNDFSEIIIPNNSMVYIDPPYYNTGAGYNCYWKKSDEDKLYKYILNINNINNSFVLSGVLNHNGIESELLKKLINYGFNYKTLDFNYDKINKLNIDKKTHEIIIKNF